MLKKREEEPARRDMDLAYKKNGIAVAGEATEIGKEDFYQS